MMNIDKIKEIVSKEYPDTTIELGYINSSNKYEVIETIIDGKITFRNIASGGTFGILDEEGFASYLIETITVQKNAYRKLDRAQIIRDKHTIMAMNMCDPTSFHKLTESELKDKIAEYEIRKDEFTKSDEQKIKESKVVDKK